MALPSGASVTTPTLAHYPTIYYPGTKKHGGKKGGRGGKK